MTSFEDITQYIPQREPMLMVDRLTEVTTDEAHTEWMVRADHCLTGPDGRLAEVGLIEHIAQSASAFVGYAAREAGYEKPPLGYIGEVKGFRCLRQPLVGETLCTRVCMGPEVGGVTLMEGKTSIGEEVVATVSMKIFVSEE